MKKISPTLILLLLNLLLTIFYFYPVLGSLNRSIFNLDGDGFKNYFTYLYFIKYDNGYHFTGMGYPFGEHMVFTDNMPAIAWTMAKLRTVFPGIFHYSLFVMHFLIIGSFTIGSVFIYKILRLFSTGYVWSIISAVFIAFFSPQVLRVNAHFGLSFVCFIPMTIYWLMSYSRTGKKLPVILLAIVSLLSGFMHIYNIGFSFIITLAYCFSYLILTHAAFKKKIKHVAPLIVASCCSIAMLQLFMYCTDQVKDRPQFPPGVLNACTVPKEIITSGIAPLGFVFQFLTNNRASYGSEGYVYVGFVSLIALLFLVGIMLKNLFLRFSHKRGFTHPVRPYRIWLFTAFLCLLLAMGIPFIWGLDFLLNHLSSFRQLRSLGRFSWGFYYLIMIFVAIWLYRIFLYLRHRQHHWQAFLLLSCIAIVWTVQLSGYARMMSNNLKNATSDYNSFCHTAHQWDRWFKDRNLNPSDFQASLGLPFFYIGPDKISLYSDNAGAVLLPLAQIAMETGMPMVDVMMSRGSWQRSFGIARIFDGPYTEKPFIDSFSNKPLLLLVNGASPVRVTGEAGLIKYADYLGDFENNKLYALDLHKVKKRNKRERDSVLNLALQQADREGLIGSKEYYYVNHFDNGQQRNVFAGNGALGKLANKTVVVSITPPVSDTDRSYNLSIWAKCDSINEHLTYFIMKQYDKEGHLINESDMPSCFSTFIDNFWFKTEKVFTVKAHTERIEFISTGYHEEDNHIALDELVMWPTGTTYFYKEKPGRIFLDNRPVIYTPDINPYRGF